ncbi:MAG: hypothetical protein QGH42_06615 [Kiritimatiellia bacterium]|jgi:hypothetical protein|nr:hypothetical protein [Kiritimatiellia bacterium]MDP6630709.1 hypothetical protein [Kiritimatiellia bacterium]MDP6809428.1 hypothetical protein [Kiritimatiellia bacterium]MDP7023895.1 hypothetical protein [Kiritimatiellia bacterium]
MRTGIALLMIAGLGVGCGKSAPPGDKAKPAPSTAQTLIEGVTGRTAVNAGQKAKADITRISEQHNRDLDAVME